MKKSVLRIIAVVAILSIMCVISTAFAAPASAATYSNTAIFMDIDGIDGESKDSKHEKWIDVISFEHGSAQSVKTGSPDVAGRGLFEPFVFKHVVDKATPKLQEACVKGNHIKSAELHFCCYIAGKQEVIYKVKLETVKIVEAKIESEELEDGSIQLVETVTLLANKQTWTKTAVGLDNSIGGNTETCYDQSKKASVFDSNTDIALTIACAVIFVLIVLFVIFFINNKKKHTNAGTKPNTNQET